MKTVWIADDDPFYQDDMKEYLEANDFEVRSFFAATDLLTELESALNSGGGLPNGIVVDMTMPYDHSPEQQQMPPVSGDPEKITGVRLTRELLNRGWGIKNTVVITAFDDSNLHATLRTLGFEPWQIFLKPSPARNILGALLRAATPSR